jgi:hypothetical protein
VDSYHVPVPDDEPQANGGDKNSQRTLIIIAVISGVCVVLAALITVFGTPLAGKWFGDKPAVPPVPGAPNDIFEPVVTLYGYTLRTRAEVSNQTVDPIHTYEPLNTEHALNVRPGDTLSFNLSCSIKPNDGNARLSQLYLTVPGGLKLVEEPRVTTVPPLLPPIAVGQILWAWVDPDHHARDTAQASFTATVSAQKSTYLTVTWSCPVFLPDKKYILDMSGAVLKVEPS